jgi:1-acyl-sn-glycerol-3-phosphate acyltransferase
LATTRFDINVSFTARVLRRATRIVYGVYAWVALLAIVLPLCALLGLTPGLRRRRRVARAAARLFFWAIGTPIRLEGPRLSGREPCVVVANHASYLDGIILTAALPASFMYLVKHEMARFPIAGFVLKRLGSAFVNREDLLDRKRIARRMLELAVKGDALAFFPEGTFDAVPGLKPFQLGAFSAAARAKLPIVPLVIYGSRHKLPAGAALPFPGGCLRVRVCEPVDAGAHESARRIMLATRTRMLAHLDEPDLA